MADAHKGIGLEFSPNIVIEYYIFLDDLSGDSDGVANPGEATVLSLTLLNIEGWVDAANVSAYLSSNNSNVNISDDFASFGDILAGNSASGDDFFEVTFSDDIDLGGVLFQLQIIGEGIDYQYNKIL